MENASGSQPQNKKLQHTQDKVDEVVGIMKMNVEKVLERDQKLSELDYRADVLQQGAHQFEMHANHLKRKYWWKNLKMMIIMGIIGVSVLILIIVWISSEFSSDSSATESPATIDNAPKPPK